MISIRNRGAHLPELASKFLGKYMRHVVNVFALLLLVLVGTVFVSSPAMLLYNLMDAKFSLAIITFVIFVYYILATLLPVDKIIGRFYPFFGALLVISALGVEICLVVTGSPIPELTLKNMHPAALPIFPLIFFTITCGALSGFHATQSPIISRTTKNEKEGRKIFYGMMIAEGGPAGVVSEASILMLGAIGGTLAILGVIILPITSGDTAFRATRMVIADYFKFAQVKILIRIWIAVPLFVISYGLIKIDFNILWR